MKIMWYVLGIVALLLIIGGFLLIISAEDFGRPIDFTKPVLHDRPNQYLVCPKDYCADTPHEFSPTYTISAQELRTLFDQALIPEQRLIKIPQNSDGTTSTYQQSSAFFKFPDRITVKFIAIDKSTSSLAIYSRAKYGRRDFDVNKARVKRWIKRLDKQVFEHLAKKQSTGQE